MGKYAVWLVLACAPAAADVITYSAGSQSVYVDGDTPAFLQYDAVFLPAFDPTLGTLESVSLQSEYNTRLNLEIPGPAGQNAGGTYQLTGTLGGPLSSMTMDIPPEPNIPPATFPGRATTVSGLTDFQSPDTLGAWTAEIPVSASAGGAVQFSDLSPFLSEKYVWFYGNVRNQILSNTGAPGDFAGSYQMDLTISYTYDPVIDPPAPATDDDPVQQAGLGQADDPAPEPSSLLLLLVPLALLAWRRQSSEGIRSGRYSGRTKRHF